MKLCVHTESEVCRQPLILIYSFSATFPLIYMVSKKKRKKKRRTYNIIGHFLCIKKMETLQCTRGDKAANSLQNWLTGGIWICGFWSRLLILLPGEQTLHHYIPCTLPVLKPTKVLHMDLCLSSEWVIFCVVVRVVLHVSICVINQTDGWSLLWNKLLQIVPAVICVNDWRTGCCFKFLHRKYYNVLAWIGPKVFTSPISIGLRLFDRCGLIRFFWCNTLACFHIRDMELPNS